MMQQPYILSGESITRYIPQRPPMVMIDTLYQSDDKQTQTGLKISAGNIFIDDGKLQAPGIIENIAQTAAIRAGYFYINNNQPVPLGFIGGIKNLMITENPPTGTQIITKVFPVQQVMNISVIKGQVFWEEQLIAQCEMKIFIQEENSQPNS